MKQSFIYQFLDNRRGLLIYWGVLLTMTVMQLIVRVARPDLLVIDSHLIIVTSSAYSLVSSFTLFIFGLNWYKPYLGYMVQNGFSRKTIFAGHLLSAAAVAGLVGVVDVLFISFSKGLNSLLDRTDNIWIFEDTALELLFGREWTLPTALLTILFGFTLILCTSSLGYLFSALYYRMNTTGKVAFSIAFPIGLFIVLPLLDHYLGGHVAGFVELLVLDVVLASPAGLILTLLASAAVLSLLAWPLVRRAPIKQNFVV